MGSCNKSFTTAQDPLNKERFIRIIEKYIIISKENESGANPTRINVRMISFDGGTTWRLGEFARQERERLVRLGKALRVFNREKFSEFSRDVNHEQGDECDIRLGLPAQSETIDRMGRNSLMPQKLWRNVMPSLRFESHASPDTNQSLDCNSTINTLTYKGGGLYLRQKANHHMKTNETGNTNTTLGTTGTPLTEEQITENLDTLRTTLGSGLQGKIFQEAIITFGIVDSWTPEFREGLESHIEGCVDYLVDQYRLILTAGQVAA